jgi:hypothetical protein
MATKYEKNDRVKVLSGWSRGKKYVDREGTIIDKCCYGGYYVFVEFDDYNERQRILSDNLRVIKRATPPVVKSAFLKNLM